jgi:putative membrane protein
MKAEEGTRGEIVPMIVARSSAIGNLPLMSSLVCFSVFLLILIEWQPWWISLWMGLPVIGLLILSLVLGTLLSHIQAVQRWLIPAHDQEAQVWQRAHSEWSQSKIQQTQGRTGILIFVSVMERKAVIMADEGIAKFYKQETWDEVVRLLGGYLKQGQWTLGFEKAIQRCGEILKTNLPAGSSNPNEISDAPIIKQ